MKKTLITLMMILAFTSTVVFAQGSKETEEESKVITMATNAEWPPLEFVDEDGNITGFEMELLQKFSEVSDYTFTPINIAWDGIFAGLANGAYDGIASGVSVTEERKSAMEFTTPFLVVTQSIIVPTDTGFEAAKIDELEGKKVGVQIGTTGDLMLQDSGYDVIIKSYDSIALAVEDLLNGNLDAVVTDSVVAGEYVLGNDAFKGKLKVSGTSEENVEPIAMCFPKGDTMHVEIVNNALKALEDNGTMDELKAKWGIL